ncbi:MAG: hypothetical protein H7281_06030 [Bacteriovorax sp.]|nr:hypothetical protein [Bacteriovorax sp.]
MKASLILALGILMTAVPSFAGEVNYSNTADLSTSATQFKLTDANYALIPTKTKIQKIPGCNQGGEGGQDCTRVVVLESEPVVQANVRYLDGLNSSGEGNSNERWLTLNFKLSDFSDDEVGMLKAAYPTWKHPFSKAGKKFAANNLDLDVSKETRTIRVVDVKHSHICSTGESGEPAPGCVEHIVYKDAETTVKAVTVSVK